jgi:HK97 gp10 family phage protein
MAQFDVRGLDDMQNLMLIMDKTATEAVPEMLAAGGKVMREAQAKEIRETFRGKRSTGDLAASIRASAVREKDGAKMVEVSPTGKDSHGVRNATKAFVLQYGRNNMPARPWFTAANVKAADAVNAEMRRVWEEKQSGGR